MKFAIFAALFIALVIFYAVKGRAWLKTKPWAQGFFAWVEPIEIALYKKSETILWARLKMLVGVTLTLLTQFGAIDITPIMPLVPDDWANYVRTAFGLLPLAITLMGMIDEKLRNATTAPIELTALPDKVVAENPKVAEAVAMADSTKTEAVAAVVAAKAA